MKNKVTKAWNTEKMLAKVLIGWSVFDIALHIAVDKVEPLRIGGNIVAILAALIIGHAKLDSKIKKYIGYMAAAVVLALNIVWAVDLGSLPLIAVVLFGGAVIILTRIGAMQKSHKEESI